MTATTLPLPTVEQTSESRRLARINADLAAIEAKQSNPQGWAKLLEDQRAELLAERSELLKQGAKLTMTTMLGA